MRWRGGGAYCQTSSSGRDQVADYHLRKGMELKDVERWLGPYLNYDPAPTGL